MQVDPLGAVARGVAIDTTNARFALAGIANCLLQQRSKARVTSQTVLDEALITCRAVHLVAELVDDPATARVARFGLGVAVGSGSMRSREVACGSWLSQ